MKKYRRKNVGSTVALDLWGHFTGRWQIRVLLENKRAHSFWASTITQFTQKNIIPLEMEIKKDRWLVYQFDSK